MGILTMTYMRAGILTMMSEEGGDSNNDMSEECGDSDNDISEECEDSDNDV